MPRHLGSSWLILSFALAVWLVACQPQRTAAPGPSQADAVAAQAQAYADRLSAETPDADEEEVKWLTPEPPKPFADKRIAYNHKPPSTVRIDHGALNATKPDQPEADRTAGPAVTQLTDPTAPTDKPAPAPADDHVGQPEDVDPAKPMTRDELVAELSKMLARESATDRKTLRPWLARVALAAIDPRYELTEAELAKLTPADRAVVLAYQQTLTDVGQSLGDSYKSDREALRVIADQMNKRINPSKTLTIKNATLCRKVKGFGVYEDFGSNTFLAGKTQPVIVYAELDHFRSLKRDDGVYVVKLTQEVVLYNDSDGLPIWRQKPVSIKDESRNVRRDFFVVQIIQLSSRLTVGKYDMKITITDELGEQVDETAIPIEIVADPSLTLRR